jgi:hypothetical protein
MQLHTTGHALQLSPCCHRGCDTTYPEHLPSLALGDDTAAICAGGLRDVLAWVRSALDAAATTVVGVGIYVGLTPSSGVVAAVLVPEMQQTTRYGSWW